MMATAVTCGTAKSGLRLAVISLLVIMCGVMIGCDALYKDQVGLWDWHQEYIGKVSHAVFQTHGSGRKRVVVATEQNSIASLNLRTGEIFWRRVLGETDSIVALEIALAKYGISLSEDGNILRAWNLPDGALFWETFLQPSLGSPVSLLVLPIDINSDKASDLLVLSGGVLFAVSTIDGSIIWKANLTSEDYVIQKVTLSAEGKLSGVGFSGTSGFVVVDIDPRFGDVHTPRPISTSKPLSKSELLVTNGVVVALDSEGSTLVTAPILPTGAGIDVFETPVVDLVTGLQQSGGGLAAKLLPTKLDDAVAISLEGNVVVFRVDASTGAVSLLEEFLGSVSISHSLEVVEGKHAVSIIQPTDASSGQHSVRVVYSDNWKEDAVKNQVKLELHHGAVRKVFVNSYLRTDRTYGFRALVVGEDDSLSLLQQGEVVWVREDGLASIIDTFPSELPLESDGHSVAEVEHDLLDWLKGHWLKLKATLFLASIEELAEVQAIRLNSAEKTKMVRDHNGFRKLLIVLTKAGKVLALHTGDGRIVWSVFLSGSAGSVPLKLLPWQIPHQHALDENPVALVLGKSGAGPDALGIVSWVDLYEGVELKSRKLNFYVRLVIPLPLTTATEQRLHLFVDDDLKAHIFPRTEESLSLFMASKPDTYFYLVNKEDGTIDGYTIKERADASSEGEGDGYVFDTARIWSVSFPSETEVISTVVSRRQDEVVHTQTKILGNRDALFKYLSKNMIFVATVTPKAAQHIGAATPEEAGMVAYLIDTVTGRILHRVSHPSMQGPVNAVFSENWVVYHYFNLRMYRYEMTVLEFYDQNRLRDVGALKLMLGRHNGSAPVSSFSVPSIDVRTQTYFFTFTVKTMTVTSTARGITGKQLLIGTVNDQVLALDKRYFDPRRTENPTPAEREEGILPLTDSIPIQTQAYLSHAYQVVGLRGIMTVPASLESTSLVFAYGLDLFYTQTAPSRTYDSLTEEFNYALLLITILVLLIGIIVTYVWSEHKELTEKWR